MNLYLAGPPPLKYLSLSDSDLERTIPKRQTSPCLTSMSLSLYSGNTFDRNDEMSEEGLRSFKRWCDVKLRAFDNAKHRTYVDLKESDGEYGEEKKKNRTKLFLNNS